MSSGYSQAVGEIAGSPLSCAAVRIRGGDRFAQREVCRLGGDGGFKVGGEVVVAVHHQVEGRCASCEVTGKALCPIISCRDGFHNDVGSLGVRFVERQGFDCAIDLDRALSFIADAEEELAALFIVVVHFELSELYAVFLSGALEDRGPKFGGCDFDVAAGLHAEVYRDRLAHRVAAVGDLRAGGVVIRTVGADRDLVALREAETAAVVSRFVGAGIENQGVKAAVAAEVDDKFVWSRADILGVVRTRGEAELALWSDGGKAVGQVTGAPQVAFAVGVVRGHFFAVGEVFIRFVLSDDLEVHVGRPIEGNLAAGGE